LAPTSFYIFFTPGRERAGSSPSSGSPPQPRAGYEADFRDNHDTAFAKKGLTYERYEPAYGYGYTLANDQRYADKEWTVVEAEARRGWEGRHQGAWEDYKDAIRYAWDRAHGPRTMRAA
jgi:hypothetical protein